LPVQYHRPGEA